METQWIFVTIGVVCLPIVCLGLPLNGAASTEAHNEFGNSQSQFAEPHNNAGFQSWTDWLDKRSFGQYPFEDNFQAWKEWMDKRSLLNPGAGGQFGAGKLPAFQDWKDWMEKRGVNADEFFKNTEPKRGFGETNNMFNHPRGTNLQSWREYSKRSHQFGSTPDFFGGSRMQHWNNMFQKRFGPKNINNPFGHTFDAKPHLMKWDEVYKRSSDKRQLGSSPTGFGQYRPYFHDGLQDWRNTFQTAKRDKTDAKNAKQQSH